MSNENEPMRQACAVMGLDRLSIALAEKPEFNVLQQDMDRFVVAAMDWLKSQCEESVVNEDETEVWVYGMNDEDVVFNVKASTRIEALTKAVIIAKQGD